MATARPEPPSDIAELQRQMERLQSLARQHGLQVQAEIDVLAEKINRLKKEPLREFGAVDRVQLARHPKRPYTLDYIDRVFTDFVELHGDRAFRDDEAIVGGWARLDGESVMVMGHQKGRDMKQNLRRNFGMPHPEGYRKALRLMHLAEKFGRPVVTLIDTPGAYPGIGAEERGQAEAIARNLLDMAKLRVPILAAVIGEGGSGGALALGLADRILMFENAIYSVISPEGCAAILWKTANAKEKAAAALKLTAADLAGLDVIDEIVPEPLGGAHQDWDAAAASLRASLARHLRDVAAIGTEARLRLRWQKYESMGQWRVAEPATGSDPEPDR